jgi:hypothetical protein
MDLNTPEFERKITATLNKQVSETDGHVIHAVGYEEAKGGGWVAVFSTEWAQLKAHYNYREGKNVNIGYSETYQGYYLSVR